MTPEEIYSALEDLPPVTLLLGPGEKELRSLAGAVALGHVRRADLIEVTPPWSTELARMLVTQAQFASLDSLKVITAFLDTISVPAQNILLKTLEEPPQAVRLILYGTYEPLPAIMSRCQVFRVSTERGADTESAGEPAQGKAAAALRAAKAGDLVLLAGILRDWDDACQAALRAWAETTAMKRGGEAPGVWEARTVLRVLRGYPRARPANLAAAALSLAFLEEY